MGFQKNNQLNTTTMKKFILLLIALVLFSCNKIESQKSYHINKTKYNHLGQRVLKSNNQIVNGLVYYTTFSTHYHYSEDEDDPINPDLIISTFEYVEENISNGKLHGKTIKKDIHGNIFCEMIYDNGKQTDHYETYPNGNIFQEMSNNKSTLYYENGEVASLTESSEEGKIINNMWYDEDGNLFYKNGIYYNNKGKIIDQYEITGEGDDYFGNLIANMNIRHSWYHANLLE
tara:strand:- start:67 stop:759 length:693 start_codon:yes stop_codon:yes gene_type:complete